MKNHQLVKTKLLICLPEYQEQTEYQEAAVQYLRKSPILQWKWQSSRISSLCPAKVAAVITTGDDGMTRMKMTGSMCHIKEGESNSECNYLLIE